MAGPLILVSYIADHFFGIHYPGMLSIVQINGINLLNILLFLSGENPIATQLWYLGCTYRHIWH